MENKENIFKQIFITRTLGFIDVSKKKHFWKELADDLGGVFEVKHTIAKDLETISLKIPYKKCQILFTESDIHPLKITCVLKARKKLGFFICFEDKIDKLLKSFGKQDIEIGDKVFDKRYLIQGTDSKTIERILSIGELKTILIENNVFSFRCIFQESDNTLNLFCLVSRTVNSKPELSELYKLFSLTIDKMTELDLI